MIIVKLVLIGLKLVSQYESFVNNNIWLLASYVDSGFIMIEKHMNPQDTMWLWLSKEWIYYHCCMNLAKTLHSIYSLNSKILCET